MKNFFVLDLEALASGLEDCTGPVFWAASTG
jgi:hypothetical protein